MRNSRTGSTASAAGRRRPADHRRQRARGAADHDVLRGRALQPDRIDHHVEEDREGEQRRRKQIDQQSQRHDRENRQREAETRRLAGRDAAARYRPAGSARHARVDVGVVPHVERAGGAGADGDAQQRGKTDHRMDVAGRDQKPDQRGEHHERHHPRLHQLHVIADARDRGLGARQRDAHRISGSVSYWWNGGGDGSVHSSVVAPGPHGLAPPAPCA